MSPTICTLIFLEGLQQER